MAENTYTETSMLHSIANIFLCFYRALSASLAFISLDISLYIYIYIYISVALLKKQKESKKKKKTNPLLLQVARSASFRTCCQSLMRPSRLLTARLRWGWRLPRLAARSCHHHGMCCSITSTLQTAGPKAPETEERTYENAIRCQACRRTHRYTYKFIHSHT